MFRLEPELTNLPQSMASLKGLELKTVIDLYYQQKQKYKNAQLDGFKNGKMVLIDEEDFAVLKQGQKNALSTLKQSFRLTNAQLFVPEIHNACESLYQEIGKVFTANLYFTPNAEAQCFVMHSDPQETLVYQMHGEKNWSFIQLENGQYLAEKFEANLTLKHHLQGKSQGQERSFILKEGGVLNFGYNLHHKARNQYNVPSVHLTFACYRPTMGELIQYIGTKVLGISEKFDHFSSISLEEALTKIKGKNIDTKTLIDEYMTHFAKQEQERRLHGRPY